MFLFFHFFSIITRTFYSFLDHICILSSTVSQDLLGTNTHCCAWCWPIQGSMYGQFSFNISQVNFRKITNISHRAISFLLQTLVLMYLLQWRYKLQSYFIFHLAQEHARSKIIFCVFQKEHFSCIKCNWSWSSVITITHFLNWPAQNQKMETDRQCFNQ